MKLTQNCVSFTNPCINLLAPPSVTYNYHPKVLELLHLLQWIAIHLQCTLPWITGETQYLGLFGVNFHSGAIARSRKPTEGMLKALLRRC